MDRAGDWGALQNFHILRICAAVLTRVLPGQCLYCPESEEFLVPDDALVSHSFVLHLTAYCSLQL